MIRRGFWLAVGAAAGIMGYRRVASLGRGLSGTLTLARGSDHEQQTVPGTRNRASRKRAAARGLARGTIRVTRDVRRFNRDVREGMEQYSARHPGQSSPTLGASTDNDERVKDDR